MVESSAVTVVTGFLGAGKSTLVERWLRELPRDDTAVIVNEQGEVGIDGALLAARAARLREITGGCVCCATQAQLASALAELAQARPARILVETSGAASPAGVLRALIRGRARAALRLDGVITVVDATRARRALGFDLAIEQLGFADVVALSRADLCDAAELAWAAEAVAPHAPGAVLVPVRRGRPVDADGAPRGFADVLAARTQALREPAPPAPSRHAPIDAVSLTLEGALDEDRFGDWVEQALGALEARLLRVKGILALAGVDARVVLQGVGEAVEVTLGAPWGEEPRVSRLVVLGLGLREERAGLEAGFAACAAQAR